MPLIKWHPPLIQLELEHELTQVREDLRTLERAAIEIRSRNRGTLERHVIRHGPKGPRPKLTERPLKDIQRETALLADVNVLQLCLGAVADPAVMRAQLKAARDTVGGVVLYETQLTDFLRAKNRKIGWQQVRLDAYLGLDPSPFADWGRSSHPPEGEAYEAALNEMSGPFLRCVERGGPPPDPEFAPDAMTRFYEAWMVRHPQRWLPAHLDAVLKVMQSKGELKSLHPELVVAARVAAVRALHRDKRGLSTLDDLRHRARALAKTPRGSPLLLNDAHYRELWRAVCHALSQLLDSPLVQALVTGEAGEPVAGL